MRREKKHINIKNPCHLQWNSLKGNGCTRFCTACSTPVTDLSDKTDSEIINFVMSQKEKVCGRLKHEQVDRIILKDSTDSSFKKILIFFTLGLTTVSNLTAIAKQPVPLSLDQLNIAHLNKNEEPFVNLLPIKDAVLTFSGKVVEADGNTELPGVNVRLKGTKIETSTDLHGNFKLEIAKDNLRGKNPVFLFSFIGYQSKEIELLPVSKDQMRIKMIPDITWLGEIHIPWYKRLWWNITSPFKKKHH